MSEISNFYCVGVSYKKADMEFRGRFNLSKISINHLLTEAKKNGFTSLVANSTCNRTELYGFIDHPDELIALLCKHSFGSKETFNQIGYIYRAEIAVDHLFRVGTGLDSQILGDFEIIAQLKKSFNQSKKFNLLGPLMERLVNCVIQASKRIKTETKLSSGSTSVSYVSVRYMLDHIENIHTKNILLFGLGKIGRNTCENLIKHTQNNKITLINRTRNRAEKIAGKFKLIVKDYADLPVEIRKADVLVVATGAEKPTIAKALIHSDKPLLILDLSIPKNVDDNVLELPNVKRLHLDDLSKMADKNIAERQKEIPLAEAIIVEVKNEFNDWLDTRKFAPTLKALKELMLEIEQQALDQQQKKHPDFNKNQALALSQHLIQKLTNRVANHMRESDKSEENIKVVQEVFNLNPHA